jgi:hypothetical protein
VHGKLEALLLEKKNQLKVMCKKTLDPRKRVEINLDDVPELFSLTFWYAFFE